MKGVIFNLTEEVVTSTYGADTWDQLLAAAGLDGAYTSLGSYPDDDLFRIVAAASSALGIDPRDVVRSIGEGAMPLLVARFPDFFAPYASTRTFLLTLNDVIHAEVRKLYPGAEVPDFDFDESDPTVLTIGYRSGRQLCALAEGFILGAATHFGETAEIDQPTCMLRGDDRCALRCRFERA